MNKLIEEEKRWKKQDTWQEALRELSDDFNNGLMTFKQFERAKKFLHRDIFG